MNGPRHVRRTSALLFALFALVATAAVAIGHDGPPRIFENEPVKPRKLLMSCRSDFSNFGPYLVALTSTIEQRWATAAAARRIDPNLSAHVSVSVTLNDQGSIVRLATAQSSTQGDAMAACIQAIADAAPFGPWSEDMVKVLGHEQSLSLTFFYSPQEGPTE
jgi:hypothetical protein